MTLTITLRHLKHFRVVAEEENFHRAAERIPTDPSSLSRTIQELEARLGVDLFSRDPRGVKITPAGEALLAYSQDLLGNFEQVVRSVREVHAKQRLPLRVGIADSLAQPRLTQRLAQWRALQPAVALSIVELRTTELASALRREEIDVGFSFGVSEDQNIVQEPVWSYPLFVLVPSNHVLADQRELTMSEVVRHPLVVCDSQNRPGVHRQIDALISRYSQTPEIADRAESLGGFITRIGSGGGIGLADEGNMMIANRPDIVVIPLRDVEASLTTFVLYRKRKGDLPETLAGFLRNAKASRS